ncbi:hypothetical protein GCM10020367_40380 [Streptomyces sannanensis]|uniref:NYN domain-containing protein n=1 Tax=Streptomyces sannanensis TaxID=285536 RepID=A0ABP6SF54_9ACTN
MRTECRPEELLESIEGRVDARGDAVLAAVADQAAERGAEVTVFTSDVDDMTKPLSGRPVEIEQV